MRTRLLFAAIAALAVLAAPTFAAGPFAQVDAGSSSIDFRPTAPGVNLTLTVSGPEGFYSQQTYGPGEAASFGVFDAAGGFLPSGSYTWELHAAPELSDGQREAMAEVRESGAGLEALRKSGKLPPRFEPMSGAFRIDQGAIVAGGEAEEAGAPAGGNRLSPKDQVILDDLIVVGSACIGQDCSNGENFGFDTLRLKENNLRIKFDDTSNTASFPNTDWQLTANETTNGGANKFSIDDISNSRTPFTIEAATPNNTLYVDNATRIGIGTNSPVATIHAKFGNTPTLRLEQDGSQGFASQIWDVAGNEANFFVRDATNGSTLPFRIQPGAPTNALLVEGSTGDVSIGAGTNPSQPLHVKRSSTDILAAGTVGVGIGLAAPLQDLHVADLEDANTNTAIRVSTASHSWDFATLENNGNFTISKLSTGQTELAVDAAGNLVITGNLSQGSSREIKHGFASVDPQAVLERVVALPVQTWIYDRDASGTRHIGPFAEDFYAAFEVGVDEKHIAPADQAGVALAAIQGLNQVVEEKDQEIEALRAEIDELRRMVQDLAER